MANSQSDPQHLVYSRLLAKATRCLNRIQYELDVDLRLKAQADEVSILFKHPAELEHWLTWARHHGLEYFDSTTDRCYLQMPFGAISEIADPPEEMPFFDVRFEFLRVPGVPWRIEAMSVLGGQADIHAPLRNHDIPHVSFKCHDSMHYDHVLAVLESGGGVRQASYVNSYGAFSYFGRGAPYLKPRVNLRDAAQRIS